MLCRLATRLALAIVMLWPAATIAQPYPSRPVTIVVAFAAGGPSDVLARILGEHMKQSLGQPVIVENVTGAGGTVGMTRVVRAPPDGYQVSLGNWGSHVASAAVYPVQFDVLKDFEPAVYFATTPIVLMAKSSIPGNDLKSLIAWLKANDDKATAATVGLGTATHLLGLQFQKATDTRFRFAIYRGVAPAIQDMIGGQVELMFGQASTVLDNIRVGQVKAFAIMAAQRWPTAPDIPTIDEGGVPGLHMALWHGMWLPKGTPNDIITTFANAVRAALADPGVRQRFAALGQDIPPTELQGPAALAALHKADVEAWWPIIRAATIKPE